MNAEMGVNEFGNRLSESENGVDEFGNGICELGNGAKRVLEMRLLTLEMGSVVWKWGP